MKEVQSQCRVNVSLRAPEESDIVMSRVDKADACKLDYGRLFRGFSRDNLVAKVQYFVSTMKVEKR